MVDEKTKNECCGCRACEQSCPMKAITMIEDEKGFFYPKIDYELCSHCGICDRVCGFRDDYGGHGVNPRVYAVKHKDEKIRSSSTSGGMFTAISDYVLEQGGIVYGAAFNHNMSVRHKRAETKTQRDHFRGSKYVQSNIGNCYKKIKDDLDNGLTVLFTGTPCQNSGLKFFLQKYYEKLILLDFVCHGTPSNRIWQDFLKVIEEDTKNRVVFADFRNKEGGWHRPVTRLKLKEKYNKKIKGEQSYFWLFNPNYMLMPACYDCKFWGFDRVSDLTIGDFWGIEKTMPDIDDNKGISLVLINSDKGRNIFQNVSSYLEIHESTTSNCLQGTLEDSPKKNPKVDEFWKIYKQKGMKAVMKRYTEYGKIRTFIWKVHRKVRYILKVKLGLNINWDIKR